MIIPILSLNGILATRAFTSVIFTKIKDELLTEDRLFVNVINAYNYHIQYYQIFNLFTTVAFATYMVNMAFDYSNKPNFHKIDKYSIFITNIERLVLIFICIFAKDIENAI